MALKRTQKKFISRFAIFLAIILIFSLLTNQFAIFGDKASYVIRCDKYTGCTQYEEDQLYAQQARETSSDSKFTDCGEPYIQCSDTAEMRGYNSFYNLKCDKFSGGGALVEYRMTCTNTQFAELKAKTVCGEPYGTGTAHVLMSDLDKIGKDWNYPTQRDFEGLDVYYADSFDVAEKSPEDTCGSNEVCKQVDLETAKCVSKDSPEIYNSKAYKGCFAISGRMESWYFDSDNELSEFISVCSSGCQDGNCLTASGEPGGDTSGSSGLDIVSGGIVAGKCEFGACTDNTYQICNDQSQNTIYECLNGCSIPTSSVCKDGTPTPKINPCSAFEQAETDGTCKFSLSNLLTSNGLKAFWETYPIWISAGLALLLVGLAYILTGKKKNNLGGF